jgi:hypothetical protein
MADRETESMRWFLLVCGLLLLAGCGGSSPPVHYHVLSVVAGSQRHAARSAKPVQVTAVHIPPSLDRKEMVSQTGPNAVTIDSQDRWSASLDLMIRRVLSQDLSERLSGQTVVMPEIQAPAETRPIVVSVLRFTTENGWAVLDADWEISDPDTNKVLYRRRSSYRARIAGTGGDAAAAGMSTLIGQLADDIADRVAHGV